MTHDPIDPDRPASARPKSGQSESGRPESGQSESGRPDLGRPEQDRLREVGADPRHSRSEEAAAGRSRSADAKSEAPQLADARGESAAFVSNDDFSRFVDGALDDDGRVRVLSHLATRPAAVERVEAYLRQNASLRALREHLPLADSAAFARPLQAALAARLTRDRGRRNWRRFAAAAAIASAVAGSAIGLAFESWRAPTPSTTTPAGRSMPQAFFLFEKPEITALKPSSAAFDTSAAADAAPTTATADETAFDWLAGQLSNVSLEAPDFARIGLELVGGVTLERQGTPAIRLIYKDEADNPVVLYVGIGKPDADHAFWLVREGYVSLQWRRGPVVFAIVTPTDSPQLSHVVDILGAAVGRLPAADQSESSDASARDNAAVTESGPGQSPVQSIAVPVPPAAPSQGQSKAPSAVAPPKIAPDATNDNQPEPL